MNSMGMKHINKPTRITKQSRSIIDLLVIVFSNKEVEVNVIYEPR